MSKNDQNKRRDELWTFEKFISITGLPVDKNSIEQKQPPYPDILCRIHGNRMGFELRAIVDEEIEKQFGTGKPEFTMYGIRDEDVVSIIEKKDKKNYVDEVELHLLIHQRYTPIDDLWLRETKQQKNKFQSAVDKSKFMSVWILDIDNEKFFKILNSKCGESCFLFPLPPAGEGAERKR